MNRTRAKELAKMDLAEVIPSFGLIPDNGGNGNFVGDFLTQKDVVVNEHGEEEAEEMVDNGEVVEDDEEEEVDNDEVVNGTIDCPIVIDEDVEEEEDDDKAAAVVNDGGNEVEEVVIVDVDDEEEDDEEENQPPPAAVDTNALEFLAWNEDALKHPTKTKYVDSYYRSPRNSCAVKRPKKLLQAKFRVSKSADLKAWKSAKIQQKLDLVRNFSPGCKDKKDKKDKDDTDEEDEE